MGSLMSCMEESLGENGRHYNKYRLNFIKEDKKIMSKLKLFIRKEKDAIKKMSLGTKIVYATMVIATMFIVPILIIGILNIPYGSVG